METGTGWIHHLELRISLPTATAILACSVTVVLFLCMLILYRLLLRKGTISSSRKQITAAARSKPDPVADDDYEINVRESTAEAMIVSTAQADLSSRCGSGISFISSSIGGGGGGGREIMVVKDFLIRSLRWSEPLKWSSSSSSSNDTGNQTDDCCGGVGGKLEVVSKCAWWWKCKSSPWSWNWRRRGEMNTTMMVKLMNERRHNRCDCCSVERCWPGRRRTKPPVWQRPILMGEKCELPRFSGLILYDERGQPLQDRTDHHHHAGTTSVQVVQPGREVTLEDLFTSINSSDRWPTIRIE